MPTRKKESDKKKERAREILVLCSSSSSSSILHSLSTIFFGENSDVPAGFLRALDAQRSRKKKKKDRYRLVPS